MSITIVTLSTFIFLSNVECHEKSLSINLNMIHVLKSVYLLQCWIESFFSHVVGNTFMLLLKEVG